MQDEFNNLMDNIFENKKDIATRGRNLIELYYFISKCQNKRKYTDIFYNKLNYRKNKKAINKIYFSNNEAVDQYVYIRLLPLLDFRNKIEFFLLYIKMIGNEMINDFYVDFSNIITIEKIQEIINYLNQEYKNLKNFPVFQCSVMNYMNKQYSTLFFFNPLREIKDFDYNIFCFNVEKNIDPVYIFFYEMGHYIHACTTKGEMNVSKKLMDKLNQEGFPKIDKPKEYARRENFTKILAIGIMYNSPYKCHDPFTNILKKDKAVYSELVKNIINNFKKDK